VLHYLRDYARPTETFVVNQVCSLQTYSSEVLCRRQRIDVPASTTGSPVEVHSFAATERRIGHGDEMLYRMRVLSPSEGRYYANTIVGVHPNLLHAHFGTDAAYIFSVIRRLRVPLVVSWYGYDIARIPRGMCGLGRLYLWSLLRSRQVMHLAMTPQMAGEIRAIGAREDSVVVHHHGIDLGYWSKTGTPRREPYLLMVGSLVEKKGHLHLLRAFAEAGTIYRDVRLVLVGDGPLAKQLTTEAKRLGIASRVDFLGYVPHSALLRGLYQSAIAFVHPSTTARNGDQEGLPGTILEAMASGLPVVATRHAGIPYAVESGVNGILVEERCEGELRDAIVTILGDDQMRRRMGAQSRKRVNADFDLAKQVQRLESLYDSFTCGDAAG